MDTIIPMHIGYIMDGNGRWAKSKGKPRTFGHIAGAENVNEVVEESFSKGVKVVSLYAFSTENWSRPKEEVEKIFSLLADFLKKYKKKLINNKIKLVISGDISKLSPLLQDSCNKIISETASFSDRVLNIALNYGSRQEIIMACNKLLEKGKKNITEEDFSKELYTNGLPDIDLIVRTSGEKRLSNFFLYQCAYSELYFSDKYWPDFNKKDVDEAIEWFNTRKRRFGGI